MDVGRPREVFTGDDTILMNLRCSVANANETQGESFALMLPLLIAVVNGSLPPHTSC
jgi:hypothetical protein